MTDANRAIALRWFDEVWNRQSRVTIDELLAPDGLGHMEGVEVRGPEEFKQVRDALLGAFPDMRLEVEAAVAEGDSVVVRWHATGSHRGDAFGLAATNAPVDFRGMTWLVIAGGRIVEGWDAWNQGSLIQSLRMAGGNEA